jgi:glyoxylase-like metal-dependent hydrolase (beta-lactamase superfamily II)
MTKLHVRGFPLGEWMTNCYVVHEAPQGGECWIVDAGFDPRPLLRYIADKQLTPSQVVLTHAHVDHIAGLRELRHQWPGLPILVHEAEEQFLTEPMLNLSIVLEDPIIAPPATGLLKAGQTLKLGSTSFAVLPTPGHSPGGITLYQADSGVALVGDALFAGSIGRTDFPTSNHDDLIRSIREQLFVLPDATRVLPGHGPETTIGHERATNPYVGGH